MSINKQKSYQIVGLQQRFETCRPTSRIQRRCEYFSSLQNRDRDSSERLALNALPLPAVSSTIQNSSHGGYYDIAVVWAVKSTTYPDDGGNKILRNIYELRPNHMASYLEGSIYQ
jgi:hypothetical protein